jgi:hypothetical protein
LHIERQTIGQYGSLQSRNRHFTHALTNVLSATYHVPLEGQKY